MVDIANSSGSRGFSGYTETDGNCINPAFLAQFFETMGAALNQAICSGREEDRVFVLERLSELSSVIDTLVDQDGFANQVAQLQQLIQTLQDQDGDGVNDLQQVKDRLDALESSYQQQQNQLDQHGQQLTNLQTAQATHAQQLANLQDSIGNISAQSLGVDVDAIRCEIVTDVYNAFQVGLTAFTDQLSVNCALPTSLAEVNTSETGDTDNDPTPPADNSSESEDVPDVL